jgi:hypothetical protein
MCDHSLLCDGKTEPCSLAVPSRRKADEWFKYRAILVRRDSLPKVADCDLRLLSVKNGAADFD